MNIIFLFKLIVSIFLFLIFYKDFHFKEFKNFVKSLTRSVYKQNNLSQICLKLLVNFCKGMLNKK